MPTHLILCAHGSSRREAVKPLLALRQAAAGRFAGLTCLAATLSGHGHGHSPAGEGLGLAQVLARAADSAGSRVAVQSLHVLPGEAHARLCATVAASGLGPDRVRVGSCLLHHESETHALAKALARDLPPRDRADAVVMAAHVQGHGVSPLLAGLAQALSRVDERVLLTSIPSAADDDAPRGQGFPASPGELLAALAARGARRVALVALLTLAGRHALHDVAGDAPHSLSFRLRATGLEVAADARGLLERPAVAGLWLDKAKQALDRLSGV